jgi:cytoskeletal protein CcmA (bactofilin family)
MFWNRPQTSSDRPSGNPPPDASHPTHPSAVAPPALPEVAPPNRRFTDGTSVCATRLGRLQIRGTLTSTESVELGGTFDGPIEVEGLVKVTEGGRVNGTIRAQDAALSGEVHGHVTARGRLELGASAHVLADVEAKTIAIAEGAFIAGRVAMPGGNGTAASVSVSVSVQNAPHATSFKEKRRDRKKRHRAAAAAYAAAHDTHDTHVEPQADGDN